MVASHERSGTHFLLNTLGGAYGYPTGDVLDLDPAGLRVNFFHAETLAGAVTRAAVERPHAIIKSHLPVDFFDGVLDQVLRRATIFYIYRDPVDVMISFWRFVQNWPWHEGPRTEDVVRFAASQPEGQMLRYHMVQQANLLQRWRHHVEGWLDASAMRASIVPIAYESLDGNFEETARGLGNTLGRPPITLRRPDRYTNVIHGASSDSLPTPDRDALRALAIAEVGDTMRRLNYL